MKVAPKKQKPFLGPMLKKLAPKIGARVYVEPQWGFAGMIVFKNGRKRYFRFNSIDVNLLGSTEISKDKDYANFFLARHGYPTVPGSRAFFSPSWAKAIHSNNTLDMGYAHAKKLGFPVIVKPNSGSQGRGVEKVHTKQELYAAARRIFAEDRLMLVQRVVPGRDYRLVVLDGEVISAYERVPLSVVGDGRSTIKKLLLKKQQDFIRAGRDTQLETTDTRMLRKLKRQHLSLSSVLKKDERVYLLDNANLSTGGESVDVTHAVHPSFKKIAADMTRDMGLRLCGVDLMVDGSIADNPSTYWVLEINSAPGLDHYVTTGKKQKKIVENLYLKVLKSMEKSP